MAGQTTRHALPYPGLTDQPDGPDAVKDLADALDPKLGRSVSTATAATRTTLTATLTAADSGLFIFQEDTDALYLWTGATTLGPLPTTGGGGGGGASGGGRWTAGTTAQNVPNTTSGPGTPIAFGSPVGTPSQVTQQAEASVGHKFELLASGVWACSATVRVQSASAGGEISCGIWADLDGVGGFDFNVAHDGARREGIARTLNPNATTYLPAGCKVVVYVFNGTGTQRVLEPNSGAWVHLDLWLVG